MSIEVVIRNLLLRTSQAVQPTKPEPYRSAIAAADVLAAPGALTLAHTHTEGGLTNVAHNVVVVANTAYGRTTASNSGAITAVTPDAGDSISVTFTAVTGAVSYDVYCSIASVAADPLWVGRVTAAQKLAGVDIQTVGVVASPGASTAAGQIDIWVVGSGLAALVNAAQSTAYNFVGIRTIDCSGYAKARFFLTCSRTGDAAARSLVVIPALYDSRTDTYSLGEPETLTFGGASGIYQSMCQPLEVDVQGNPRVALLVAAIAGTGMSVDVDVVLS